MSGKIKQFAAAYLVFVALAACQPQIQQSTGALQDPVLTDDVAVMSDGTHLPMQQWKPNPHAPEAVIVALHGFNDYSQAFQLAGEYLPAKKIALYAYDQRGFGKTNQRGIWAGYENLTNDLREVTALLKARHPNAPLYVMGESMGGAVVISACANGGCPHANGAILVAPAVWGDSSLNEFYRASLWLMAHTVPGSEWTGEDLDITATDNNELLYAMGMDPLVIKETRIDALYGIVQLMDKAQERIADMKLPTLVLYGAKDEVIPPLPVAQALKQLKASHTVGYYENGYHMLLRDLQREVVLRDIASWVDNRYHPLPSGSDMGWKEELLAVVD